MKNGGLDGKKILEHRLNLKFSDYWKNPIQIGMSSSSALFTYSFYIKIDAYPLQAELNKYTY